MAEKKYTVKSDTPKDKPKTKNKASEKSKKAVKELANTKEQKRILEKRRRLHAIVPWLLGLVSVYLIICYIVLFTTVGETGLVGFIGVTVVPICFGMFGIGALLIPIYLLNIAFFYKNSRENNTLRSKCISSLINLIIVSMLLHLFVIKAPNETMGELFSSTAFINIYKLGTDLRSGGLVGGYICEMLRMGMGYVGAMIVCWVLTFLSFLFVIGMTPGDALDKLGSYIKAKQKEHQEAKLVEAYEREEREKAMEKERLLQEKEEEKQKKKDQPFELPSVPVLPPQEPEHQTEAVDKEEIKTIPEMAEGGENIPAEPDNALEIKIDNDIKQEPAEELPQEQQEQPPFEVDAVKEEESIDESQKPYIFPPISLLVPGDTTAAGTSQASINATSEKLVRVLESFKVRTTIMNVSVGPAVTRYELQPAEGVKTKAIANLSDDIALHLAARSVRIEAPIPGKSAVGIELPNETVSVVRLRDLIETKQFKDARSPLSTCLGMDVTGNPVFLDISKMPHLLIAGATGMGKSVCMNSILISLLYKSSPYDVKLILIDPKKVELNIYNGIPHLLVPVVTDPKKAAGALNWAVTEMERRFNQIQDVGAHDISEYNELTKGDPEKEHMVSIVIFIDELADLMMSAPDDVETSICRLSQKARAAGIHLIIGTQRPSVDVITGLIKSNIPSRIAFTVASQIDSRTIIDIAGAEKLMGRGDMLYNPVGMLKPLRVQGSFVETKEVVTVCEYIKRTADSGYNSDIIESIEREALMCGEKPSKRAQMEAASAGEGNELLSDDMILPAIEVALDEQTISTSLLQRKLKLGYSRAAKIIDIIESNGFVSKFDPSIKGRKILITRDEYSELKLKLQEQKD